MREHTDGIHSFLYIQMSPVDEENEELVKQSSVCLRSPSSEEDSTDKVKVTEENLNEEKIRSVEAQPAAAASETSPKSWRSSSLGRNLTNLKIPKRDELFERLENGNLAAGSNCDDNSAVSPLGGYDSDEEEEEETAVEQDYMSSKTSLVEEDEEEEEEKDHDIKEIPKELILHRQLSCQWTTGAGARISCVRDHPSKLQVRALEHVNLSPRSAGHSRSEICSPVSSPVFEKRVLPHRSIHHSKIPFSPLSRASE